MIRARQGADNSVVLRLPTDADCAALGKLHVAVWRDTYGHLLKPDHFGDSAELERTVMWRTIIGADNSASSSVVVAEERGQLIGFGHVGPAFEESPARRTQLHSLHVARPWQGHGVGRRMLDRVLDSSPAQLWVADSNARALNFYRQAGFVPDGASSTAGPLPEIRLVR